MQIFQVYHMPDSSSSLQAIAGLLRFFSSLAALLHGGGLFWGLVARFIQTLVHRDGMPNQTVNTLETWQKSCTFFCILYAFHKKNNVLVVYLF